MSRTQINVLLVLIAIAVFCAIIATRKYLLASDTLQVNVMMPNPLQVQALLLPLPQPPESPRKRVTGFASEDHLQDGKLEENRG